MKTCKICGADISERKGNAKYCPKCSKEKALERNRQYKDRQKNYCQRCGKDISDRAPHAKYCLDCIQKQTRKPPKTEIFSKKQCKTCKYRSDDPDYSCNYISVTGQRRNCPQPPNCTKYKKRKTDPEKMEIRLQYERRI